VNLAAGSAHPVHHPQRALTDPVAVGPSRRPYAYEKGPPPIDLVLARAAERCHAVFSTAELTALGLTRDQRLRRARTGRLHRLYPGVYALDVLLTPLGRWRAAVLACGPGAVLSHVSAGARHRLLDTARRNVDVSTPARGRKGHAGIALHRVRSLDPRDVTVSDGIPVTTVGRTLVDLAGVLPAAALRRAWKQAEIERILDVGEVRDALGRARGRRGTGRLRALLPIAAAPTRSELEDRFLALVHHAALPAPQVDVPIGPYVADFLWPDRRLIVETDGRRTHAIETGLEDDHVKDADLAVLGFRVVRFTWRRVTERPQEVVRVLRALLAAER
jgi:hypothetical protein